MTFESIREALRQGNTKLALKIAEGIRDPFSKLRAYSFIAKRIEDDETIELTISRMFEALKGIRGEVEIVRALSLIGYTAYWVGKVRLGDKAFSDAETLANRINYLPWRALALGYIGYYLALAEPPSEALRFFEKAVLTLLRSRGPYSELVSTAIRLAGLIVSAGDETSNEKALEMYSLARDLYMEFNMRMRAKVIEEKIAFVEGVLKEKNVQIVKLLEMGDIDRAILGVRYLEPKDRIGALLEIAYWLFLHNRSDLAVAVLEDAYDAMLLYKVRPDETEIERVAYKFLKLGALEEALTLTGLLKDREKVDRLLSRIALAYAKRGDIGKALNMAEGIKNELVKRRLLRKLEELGGEEHVGHEQGLQTSGGGEKR
ncbi:hypothetical protein [Pyrococcus yayanosii]|uniref:TRP-repeat-containing protein n=1 Tax=Pyrococcus yayanosii (strain CH1 / JCM 16557) TaxID=529709 RepID=F8AI31_PYRYC|nr:hypothetical protein [Pyrococcus yayanosii]AEH25499.1 hypothetical protein PYCH_18440 [Pyrococcus yayanosii CH1]